MKCLISVIIPVYNTEEQLLRNCLDSVLNQTYREIEILLADDGSVEAARKLYDELAAGDERIKVLHLEHQGVSAARNAGTSAANGEYVMYVDSDDVLAKYAIEEGVSAAAAENADYIFAAVKSIRSQAEFGGGSEHAEPKTEAFSAEQKDYIKHAFITLRGAQFTNIEGSGYVNRGPCAKLIRASVAKETPFDTQLVLGEDVEWNMRILSRCEGICFVNSIWYGYVHYEQSSLHKYYGNREELLAEYHNTLYSRNTEFFQSHPKDYAINMATSFMLMIRSEFLSKQCPLSEIEKIKKVKEILKKEPWTVLTKKEMQASLPVKHRVLIKACQHGYGIWAFRLRDKIVHNQ